MKFKNLGNSGISASVIGFGAWAIGGGSLWGGKPDDNQSIRAIHAALDNGITLIDTAPIYGFGHSEEVIGKALKGKRDKYIVATKCGLWWDDNRGSFFATFEGKPVFRCLRPETIMIEIDRSLRRLQTDYIDLYQTHWQAVPPDKTPIEDTMNALLKLQKQGKIRAIGVSNASVDEMNEYLKYGQIVSSQFRYSILHRQPEDDILPYCAEKNLATLTYMSLEQGLLTGKIGMDRVFGKEEFRANEAKNPWFKPENRRKVLDMLAGWKKFTDKYNCTLAQLVLAWTLAQKGVTHVLCGARNEKQVLENAPAGDLVLEKEDIERMRADAVALGKPV
jgi:methylglyoxal reductase